MNVQYCGRIELDESRIREDGKPPDGGWYACCAEHDWRGPGRARRFDAVDDLEEHHFANDRAFV